MASFHAEELEEVLKSASAKIEAGEDASTQLDEADELVAQLRIDARGKEAKQQLREREARIRELRSKSLFSGAKPASSSAKGRLMSTTERAKESNRRIENTQSLVDEIEDTGNDIIGELQRNRETMKRIDGHVKETKGELEKADKIVTRMGKWWSRW
ncbi:hypothetical protein CTAYLR_002413 [Chrysophaeum taylorii]|uniref:t-SNARE coiled-coil homology domain-containing protein n=1 Tax=Chrysophaeum taylorii TaxID=2483200 RepID=A0AAD7UGG5_9STRA|nr:hypothetical protein CTAYLR_002413 [Chrysophaeum taylorii]